MSGAVEVVAVILAAGGSSRLGSPKQLARLGEEALLERAIRTAREAGCVPLVVLGARAEEILRERWMDGVRSVENADWPAGMGSSIAVGVSEAMRMTGPGPLARIVVMTCDQPAVGAAHLRALMEQAAGGEPAASIYAGRKGVPACFPEACFSGLLALQGDAGARDLLRSARVVPLPGGELDVDTAESLEQARERFGG